MCDDLCLLSAHTVESVQDIDCEAERRLLFVTARTLLSVDPSELEEAAGELDGEPPFTTVTAFTTEHLFHDLTFDVISPGDAEYEIVTIGRKRSESKASADEDAGKKSVKGTRDASGSPQDVFRVVIVRNDGNPMGCVFRGSSDQVYLNYVDGGVAEGDTPESELQAAALNVLIALREEGVTLGEMRSNLDSNEDYRLEFEEWDVLNTRDA